MKYVILIIWIICMIGIFGQNEICTTLNCAGPGEACGLQDCTSSSSCSTRCAGYMYCLAGNKADAFNRVGTCQDQPDDVSGAPCQTDSDCAWANPVINFMDVYIPPAFTCVASGCRPILSVVGDGCTSPANCTSNVCTSGLCAVKANNKCKSSSDCAPQSYCSGGYCAAQLATGTACTYSYQC